jgi:putative Holliday junction resolvase
MSRVLALDYGKKRIGVAVSDPTRTLATGLPTLEHRGLDPLAAAVQRLVGEYGADEVLLGLPLEMDGTRGRRAQEVERFAAELRARLSVPVTFWDERLSTVRAYRVLRESGVNAKRGKERVDRLSAVLILQAYLDAGGGPPTPADRGHAGGPA